MSQMRLYEPHELGADGYPAEWHAWIKHRVRHEAGFRCVRCQHPYLPVELRDPPGSRLGEWSPCDERCTHEGPIRIWGEGSLEWLETDAVSYRDEPVTAGALVVPDQQRVEAQWRILTVHHLDGDKANCRWWNLASLCQRCHLQIQGKVRMERVWPWEHTEWFRPYVAGFYAWTYLGQDLTRREVDERLVDLLALELAA